MVLPPMNIPCVALIAPVLATLPIMLGTAATRSPTPPALILPLLLTPPEKREAPTVLMYMPVMPARMFPLLMMEPPKVPSAATGR